MIDESQICNKRYVNVIVENFECPKKYYLVNVVEIFEPPNSRNQSVIIDDTIKNLELLRNHFRLLISDAASYMLACGKILTCFIPICYTLHILFMLCTIVLLKPKNIFQMLIF